MPGRRCRGGGRGWGGVAVVCDIDRFDLFSGNLHEQDFNNNNTVTAGDQSSTERDTGSRRRVIIIIIGIDNNRRMQEYTISLVFCTADMTFETNSENTNKI